VQRAMLHTCTSAHVSATLMFAACAPTPPFHRCVHPLRIMSADGCQRPTWTGQAFSYLMHHPSASSGKQVDCASYTKHHMPSLLLPPAKFALLSAAEHPLTVASAGDVAPAPGNQV
jgi:hypothetical protein